MIGRKYSAALVWIVAAGALVGVVGCSGDKPDDKKTAEAPVIPTQGTHGGRLVELGAKEYFVEVAHDPTVGTVSFHLLDSAAKKKATIAAFEMVVKTKVGAASTEHKIFSQPDKGDTPGQTSRFVATEKNVVDAIIAPGTEVEIVITSGDKKLNGSLKNEVPAATGTATAGATGTSAPATKPTSTAAPSPTATQSATATPTASGTGSKK
jgi:hypothetical protein